MPSITSLIPRSAQKPAPGLNWGAGPRLELGARPEGRPMPLQPISYGCRALEAYHHVIPPIGYGVRAAYHIIAISSTSWSHPAPKIRAGQHRRDQLRLV